MTIVAALAASPAAGRSVIVVGHFGNIVFPPIEAWATIGAQPTVRASSLSSDGGAWRRSYSSARFISSVSVVTSNRRIYSRYSERRFRYNLPSWRLASNWLCCCISARSAIEYSRAVFPRCCTRWWMVSSSSSSSMKMKKPRKSAMKSAHDFQFARCDRYQFSAGPFNVL